MSARPRRACTQAQVTPVLSDIVEQVKTLSETEIRELFQKTQAFFKQDLEAQSQFWLSDTTPYTLSLTSHQQLVALILEQIPLRDDRALAYLNSILTEQVESLGLVRAMRAGKFYYRIRTGHCTEW